MKCCYYINYGDLKIGEKVHTDQSFGEDHHSIFSSNGMYYEGILKFIYADKGFIQLGSGDLKIIKLKYLLSSYPCGKK